MSLVRTNGSLVGRTLRLERKLASHVCNVPEKELLNEVEEEEEKFVELPLLCKI